MPTYVYENSQGERREIVGTMKNPPACEIRFDADGRIEPVLESELAAFGGATAAATADPGIFLRVFGLGLGAYVPNHGVSHQGVPISRSLPRRRGGVRDRLDGHEVLRHADGGFSDLQGRPIVQNKRDSDREQKRSGLVRE